MAPMLSKLTVRGSVTELVCGLVPPRWIVMSEYHEPVVSRYLL